MAQINKPTDYFNTVLYTGNGSNDHTITGVGFNTDLAWIKNRGGDDHRLFDKVRGVNKFLKSNTNDTETTDAIFTTNADGYVVTNAGEVNANNGNFVGWNWKANGQGSSNTAGSINTTYTSANTAAGFSISKYVGTGANATVGHGLGVAPKMYICKSLSSARSWVVYHQSMGNTKAVFLNSTDAQDTDNPYWNATSPTNSTVSLGHRSEMNHSGENFIMYCFAEKKGYSKIGSYVGNGSTDGTFIYTGFKPAFVMFKRTSGTGNWQLLDNKRLGYNVENRTIYPNSNIAEQDENDADLLSNGFKLRGSGNDGNGSGSTYIYMAFAEQPLVGSNNIPATAR